MYNLDTEAEKVPILVCTDFGHYCDDLEALIYIKGNPHLEIVGFVVSHTEEHYIDKFRDALDKLGYTDCPVAVGSTIYPHQDYTRETRQHYENSSEIILNAVDTYKKDLVIAAIGPLTDLAEAANRDPKTFSQIKHITIMGQCKEENGNLVPDSNGYNMRKDKEAATTVLSFQDEIAFTVVGKYACYPLQLFRDEVQRMVDTGHPLGQEIYDEAQLTLEITAKKHPDLLLKNYGISPNEIYTSKQFSNPFDTVAAMSITNPELFYSKQVGNHTLIGNYKDDDAIVSVDKAKKHMVETMLNALTQSYDKKWI